MRYFDSGEISHEICNHEMFWFWCNNSWNLNPWDTWYWAYIFIYDILESFIQSNSNQSSQSIKTADQTNASFERFLSCFWSIEQGYLRSAKNKHSPTSLPKLNSFSGECVWWLVTIAYFHSVGVSRPSQSFKTMGCHIFSWKVIP